jgi:hypothetical protein
MHPLRTQIEPMTFPDMNFGGVSLTLYTGKVCVSAVCSYC